MASIGQREDSSGMAEAYEKSLGGLTRLQPGQVVETRVLSIGNEVIFLELGGKSEGLIDAAEFTDQDGALTVAEGDAVKVFFLENARGELRFTRRVNADKAGQAMLESARANGIPVEGMVEREIKGGYEVRLGEAKAFCPYSQMALRREEDPAACIGRRLSFMIKEYGEGGRRVLVSRREILEAERERLVDGLRSSLREGQVVRGKITSIQSFGAFVDLGGVQALLPASEIARERVADIASVLSPGQEIEAVLIKADWQNERLSLSMKSLLADPWESALEKYPKGSRHRGKVVRLANYGSFVSLEPGLDGLLHDSELEADAGSGRTGTTLKLGQEIDVRVIEVDKARRRISLKPANSPELDEVAAAYMDQGDADGGAYNPFAALLKGRK